MADRPALRGSAEPRASGQEGRGRLSSLDLVGEEGRDDIFWALSELNRRERTQADILFELNDRLEAKGLAPISRSAFNRKAVRLAAAARRLDEARHLFAGLADQFTPERIDEGNIGLGEVLKTLIFELTDPDHSHGPKEAMELARAYLATIQGQRLSSDRRHKLEKEFSAKTTAAIDQVAREKGLTGDTVAAIKAQILGVAG
jgi:hypothetical protein